MLAPSYVVWCFDRSTSADRPTASIYKRIVLHGLYNSYIGVYEWWLSATRSLESSTSVYLPTGRSKLRTISCCRRCVCRSFCLSFNFLARLDAAMPATNPATNISSGEASVSHAKYEDDEDDAEDAVGQSLRARSACVGGEGCPGCDWLA